MSKADWTRTVEDLLRRDHETPEHRLAAEALRARFRWSLREARARVQADGEGFEVVIHAIERLGRHLDPMGTGLRDYEDPIRLLVARAGLETSDLDKKLFLLRQTRNDAAHQGSYARNAAREAVHVALRLEDALSVGWSDIELLHVMVRDPVMAQPGDTLGDIRQAMLEHAFTAVPARVRGRWFVLTDQWLARNIAGMTTKTRHGVLRQKVEDLTDDDLAPLAATPLPGNEKVSALAAGDHLDRPLVLVAPSPDSDRLDGVVAPADLL